MKGPKNMQGRKNYSAVGKIDSMATDPNFALRTHERLFTGPKKNPDEELRKAAFAAVPICGSCGQVVMFKNNVPTHYDGSLDMDLKPMEKAAIAADAKNQDQDHTPLADVPTNTGAPAIPARRVGARVVAKPDPATAVARGVETRKRNREADAKRSNTLLGRQWNPLAYDESGIAKPASERF
jgi:hypothetical protein